mmetsp:Transcript_12772/g.43255  ORF Transcript_12772/g.43255 Transcript_12772/m.43255 type:complete len:385 (-) Transcript_12772:63-1217(-)
MSSIHTLSNKSLMLPIGAQSSPVALRVPGVGGEHEAERAGLGGLRQLLDALRELGDRVHAPLGRDAVARRKVEHLVGEEAAAHRGARVGDAAKDELHEGDLRLGLLAARRRAELHDGAAVAHEREIRLGGPAGCGVEQDVNGALERVERLGVRGVHVLRGATLEGLLLLGRAARHGHHAKPHFGAKLEGEVAQATHADDAHPGPRVGHILAQRAVHGDARAEQRGDLRALEGLRHRERVALLHAHVRRKAAGAREDESRAHGAHLIAEGLVALVALAAVVARVAQPAHGDAVPDLDAAHGVAHLGHDAHVLVAGARRVLAHAPVVDADGEVGVAERHGGDSDLDHVRPEGHLVHLAAHDIRALARKDVGLDAIPSFLHGCHGSD